MVLALLILTLSLACNTEPEIIDTENISDTDMAESEHDILVISVDVVQRGMVPGSYVLLRYVYRVLTCVITLHCNYHIGHNYG